MEAQAQAYSALAAKMRLQISAPILPAQKALGTIGFSPPSSPTESPTRREGVRGAYNVRQPSDPFTSNCTRHVHGFMGFSF